MRKGGLSGAEPAESDDRPFLSPPDLSSTIVSLQFHGPGREALSPLLITVNSETVDWTRLSASVAVARSGLRFNF